MRGKIQNMLESPFARWGILLLLGIILSANYYFYDAFSSLKPLLTKEFSFTNTQYGLFRMRSRAVPQSLGTGTG